MVMRLRLLILLALLGLGLPSAFAEPAPLAFVTLIELKGADLDAGTAIRRGGEELRPRLLMPLYAGDEVFLRDASSRIVLETESGDAKEVSGAGVRFAVAGEAAADGGFWGLLGAVADAVSTDGGEVAPDNMMSRDTDEVINVPMAVRGANHVLRDGRPVWLAWRGGKAPYRVSVSADHVSEVHDDLSTEEFSVALRMDSPRRVKITIEDAGGRKTSVMLKLRDERPKPPFDLVNGTSVSAARTLAYAAWLTNVDDGSWSLEAARLLRGEAGNSPAASLLLGKIAEGWKAGGGKNVPGN